MHPLPLSVAVKQQGNWKQSEASQFPPVAPLEIATPITGSILHAPQLFQKDHRAMATTWSLLLYSPSQSAADIATDAAFREIDRIEDLLSRFRECSEMSRINRDAFPTPVTTDPETFRFLETALRWSARSNGAFDITVGRLMRTWGFFDSVGRLPTDRELAAANMAVGWQNVTLDPSSRTVRFLAPQIELDPGGIGKGYAVDRAIRTLRQHGVSSALLSAGSSTIHALGAPLGEPGWTVRVPVPACPDRTLSSVTLRDTSLSTASPAEKHFVHQGRLYGHIMDPRTLRPVADTAQVSVISPSSIDSDALSNALFVLGPYLGQSLLQTEPLASALIVQSDDQGRSVHPICWPAPLSPESA